MMIKLDRDSMWASVLAAKLTQELKLPAGNLWEPSIARRLERRLQDGPSHEQVETEERERLGLACSWCENDGSLCACNT